MKNNVSKTTCKIISRPGQSQGLLYKHLCGIVTPVIKPTLLTFFRNSISWRASKSLFWFKSYGDFAERVDFAYWWSCIGKGLPCSLRSRLVTTNAAIFTTNTVVFRITIGTFVTNEVLLRTNSTILVQINWNLYKYITHKNCFFFLSFLNPSHIYNNTVIVRANLFPMSMMF